MKRRSTHCLYLAFLLLVGACEGGADSADNHVQSGQDVAPDADSFAAASPGKTGAPVDIRYEVVGKPIVGVPVSINLQIHSRAGPLNVVYSIDDASALQFQDGQVERLEVIDAGAGSAQQLTVVPQREGRVYVNVSAEVPAEMGTLIRSIAIPIRVGNAPKETTPNGSLVEGPDGEKVISLPANE